MKVTSFRYDINALRALAVVSVVLFHFFPHGLPGGFVGVDIFFVISDFLMTSIVVTRVRERRFSLIDFYRSRLYRIMPALLVLCLLVFIFGLIVIDPITLKSIGKHIFSSLGFISNYVYNAESGYFSENSRLNWFLHTWSLSVEWQFYCVYPLLILFGYKLGGEQKLKIVLGLTLLVSLGLAIYQGVMGGREAFFLLEYRAWELILGGCIYFLKAPEKVPSARYQYLGISCIALSIFLFSEKLMWPSYYALLPTLGTAFIIYAANNQRWVMQNNVVYKLGLWSYSIYLWHWPIVVGLEYFGLNHSAYIALGLIASVVLGALSYSLVESKITMSKQAKSARLKVLFVNKLVLFTCVLGVTGLLAFKFNGFMFRFDNTTKSIVNSVKPSPNRNRCTSSDASYIAPKDGCTFLLSNENYAVLGDSHSIELSQALVNTLKGSQVGLRQYSYSACAPKYNMQGDTSLCGKWTNTAVESIVKDDTISHVIISYRMSSHLFGSHSPFYPDLGDHFSDEHREKVILSYSQMIQNLVGNGKSVVLVAPVPELGESVKVLVKRGFVENGRVEPLKIGTTRNYYERRNYYFLNALKQPIFNKKEIFQVFPSDYFCDENSCYVIKNKKSLYFDDDHMSMHGATIMAKQIIKSIQHTKI